MDHHFLVTIATTIFLLVLTNLPQSHCEENEEKHRNCSRPYNCGVLRDIYYPFWDGIIRPQYCGGGHQFKLSCHNYTDTWIQLKYHQDFLVHSIHPLNYTIIMERKDLVIDYCSPDLGNTSLDPTLFNYTENVHNITIFFNCPPKVSINASNFTCPPAMGGEKAFYVDDQDLPKLPPQLNNCKRRIQVQASRNIGTDSHSGIGELEQALSDGFEVKYTVPHFEECRQCFNDRKGACGINEETHEFECYPPGSQKTLNLWRKIVIGVASAVFGALVVFTAFYVRHRRKKNSYAMSYVQSQSLSSDPSLKDTEKGSLNFVPGLHLFSYNELEEATNYFDSSRELGEGGFGTVYFGKLRDGRCVAVKRLFENNYRRVEQFMNEIEILTRLIHPNLVSLYGCTSRHGRELLLVYEYIPNGTVADHLHGERAKPGTFPWHIRMNIAVETASALKYLHASDIIHRDVKTNNILLDSHFRVKVADFGLSRLFPNDVSHISTAPQGTPGYVDPEYHECYQLTCKSDVYSFGVVLIELISALPAVDITRHRHEINLANMAINKIHNQALHELVDSTLGFESDQKVRKMINAVAELAFQCLQSSKDMRPSMEEVLDTLKDIQSGGKHKSQPEVMDISSSADDVVLLKDDPPPPSPDSNAVSKSTTPNSSG
ncbi:hypothetical protein VNO77_33110 [Canavalia gladiata]|uniref:non-specific serine/threonine protein kinase n=1 Tax=Canavalia gladiata TaxID=3824 RepID=A0AAN9PYK8_CANGL